MKRLIIILRSSLLIFLTLTGSQVLAQAQGLPGVTVRFNNPKVNCENQTYCVDVEFLSDTPEREIVGMNVRFFYDGSVLEFFSAGSFQGDYIMSDYETVTGLTGSGPLCFGLNDPLKYFNGYLQLQGSANPVYISTDPEEWTKLFTICFRVINLSLYNFGELCASLIWDLTEEINPETGEKIGFLTGNDGVMINLVIPGELTMTEPTTEDVVQFNWAYDGEPDFPNGGFDTDFPAGYPLPEICTEVICGYAVPLKNWALFLAIGLMILVTVVLYRRVK